MSEPKVQSFQRWTATVVRCWCVQGMVRWCAGAERLCTRWRACAGVRPEACVYVRAREACVREQLVQEHMPWTWPTRRPTMRSTASSRAKGRGWGGGPRAAVLTSGRRGRLETGEGGRRRAGGVDEAGPRKMKKAKTLVLPFPRASWLLLRAWSTTSSDTCSSYRYPMASSNFSGWWRVGGALGC